MNKINDCFNNTFDNIKLSKSQSNDLNQRIILGYKKRKRNKKIKILFIISQNPQLFQEPIKATVLTVKK